MMQSTWRSLTLTRLGRTNPLGVSSFPWWTSWPWTDRRVTGSLLQAPRKEKFFSWQILSTHMAMIAVEIHQPLQRAFPEVLRGETHLIALAAEKGPVLIPTEEEDQLHYLVKDKEEGVVQEILLIQ